MDNGDDFREPATTADDVKPIFTLPASTGPADRDDTVSLLRAIAMADYSSKARSAATALSLSPEYCAQNDVQHRNQYAIKPATTTGIQQLRHHLQAAGYHQYHGGNHHFSSLLQHPQYPPLQPHGPVTSGDLCYPQFTSAASPEVLSASSTPLPVYEALRRHRAGVAGDVSAAGRVEHQLQTTLPSDQRFSQMLPPLHVHRHPQLPSSSHHHLAVSDAAPSSVYNAAAFLKPYQFYSS